MSDIALRLSALEARVAKMLWPATVAQRDHEKGVRFEVAKDDDGNPVLSAWVQPGDQNKGTRSRWLPQIGAQALVMTPAGHDYAMGFIPMSHHDNSPNPAKDADETVIFDDGACRLSASGGIWTLKSGSSVITISDGHIEIKSESILAKGSSLKHNEKNVGDTHIHDGVMPGGGDTGFPV